jgi:hypothetical protein
VLIPAHRQAGAAVQPGQPGQAVTGQDPVHGGGVQAQQPADPGPSGG